MSPDDSISHKAATGLAIAGHLAVCLLFAAVMIAVRHYDELRAWVELHATTSPAERNLLAQVSDAERIRYQDPMGALAELDTAVRRLEGGPAMRDRVAARLYTLRGDVFGDLYQYTDALADWQRAQARASPQERMALEQRVAQTQRNLEVMNKERNNRSVYLASPNVGPAAILAGRIAVAYVFVRDRSGGAWGLRDRELALASWGMAEAWLAARARQYGTNVRFTRRVFLVDRNPEVRRLQVGYGRSFASDDAAVARLVADQLGATSVLGFLYILQYHARADQAVMILHLARDGRSLSRRCLESCGPDGEFAYVLDAVTPKGWDRLAYAQAHETLHLFGADDLYNIRGAYDYAARDIMNYPSRLLRASTLEPITAYATGLQRERPAAPFRIVRR